MIYYPLIFGELTAESYTDAAAANPRIDALRAKIECVEEKQYNVDYHDPSKRSISNTITVTLNDGTVLDEAQGEYAVGHKRRRAEGTPLSTGQVQEAHRRGPLPGRPPEEVSFIIDYLDGQH